jgi:hypothetical protein
MIQEFKNWLIGRGNIGAANGYPCAINRLSTHYSENIGENVDIYSLRDIDVVNEIARKYRQDGIYSNYGDEGHGLYRCAIAKYSVFLTDYLAGNDLSEGILPPLDNDNVICKSLIAKSIEPSSVRPDGRYTNPRTWGVYQVVRIIEGNRGKEFHFGNHPVRQQELIRQYGDAQLVRLYEARIDAKEVAYLLNGGHHPLYCGVQETIMYDELDGELRAIFGAKPYQGQDPEKAKVLFVGRDANYPDLPCKHPFFERIKEYHRDGVAFWEKYEVHHPFLCDDFPFPRNAGGRPYHKNFTKLGLDWTYAQYISFIELRELPTRGVTGKIPKSVFISKLKLPHMQRLDRWISQSGRKLVFLPKTIREDMQKFRKDDRNLFQFLNFSPPVSLNAFGLPVIYAEDDVLVLETCAFSAWRIFGITSKMKTVIDLFLQGHQVPLMETGKTGTP